MEVPSSVWEALVILLGTITVYLGTLVRNARKNGVHERRQVTPVEIDYVALQEHLRVFIDDRAKHQARNVFIEFVGRLTRLESDMDEIREERKLLYRLVEGIESVKETVKSIVTSNNEQFLKLTEGVARLQGANDAK